MYQLFSVVNCLVLINSNLIFTDYESVLWFSMLVLAFTAPFSFSHLFTQKKTPEVPKDPEDPKN